MKSTVVILSAIIVSAHAQFFLSGLIQRAANAITGSSSSTGSNTAGSTYTKPAFCKDLECPRFNVLETNDNFELRQYEPSVWAATKKSVMLLTREESRPMFFSLFRYISGRNSEGAKIPMTAPVLMEIEHGHGPDSPTNFTMNFMMTFDRQSNTPLPTDPAVFIRRMPAVNVYVKSYGGFANEEIKMQKLMELKNDLDAANKMFDDTKYYTAGYDSPYTFFNRHNEIWVEAK